MKMFALYATNLGVVNVVQGKADCYISKQNAIFATVTRLSRSAVYFHTNKVHGSVLSILLPVNTARTLLYKTVLNKGTS